MQHTTIRRHDRILAPLAAIATLAACSAPANRESGPVAPDSAGIRTVSYTCADGRRIEARYDNSVPGKSSLRLEVDGRSFEMFAVVAASGARYSTESGLKPDHGLQWWTKGREATLSEILMDHTTTGPVALTTCTAQTEG
jgi:membrane-bound inhibitor of C-type lysozyme